MSVMLYPCLVKQFTICLGVFAILLTCDVMVCSSIDLLCFLWSRVITTKWELIQGTNTMEEDLLDTIQELYWTQHVGQPTRIRATDTPRIIDLVLTTELNMIEEMGIISS